MTDQPGALWMPSPYCWQGRNGYAPKWIILHGTAGGSSAQAIATWFQNPASQVSAHYIVGQDGMIVECVAEQDSAWANGIITGPPGTSGDGVHHDTWWSDAINPNYQTISIEHVKQSTDNSDALTPAQQAASFTLVADICQRWNIPARQADSNGGITGHFSIDPVNRARCPGTYPWQELWNVLGGNTMAVPQGWQDDGTTLVAPNGVPVKLGFRAYILENGWNAQNVPLQAEEGRNPLELSNPGLGSGTQQLFRWSTLEWTADRGVFLAWTGTEILALRAQVAQLQQQLADTQKQPAPTSPVASTLPEINQLAQQIVKLSEPA